MRFAYADPPYLGMGKKLYGDHPEHAVYDTAVLFLMLLAGAAFGLYYIGKRWDDSFVALWGSEEQYRAKTDEESNALWPGPFCEDGFFKWEWWHKEGPR